MRYLILLLLLITSAASASERDHDRARRALLAGEIVPLEAVLERVRSREPGRIIEVELEDHHARQFYEVKLMTPEGRLRRLRYDARTLEPVDR